jgi:YD repeat-containing protein
LRALAAFPSAAILRRCTQRFVVHRNAARRTCLLHSMPFIYEMHGNMSVRSRRPIFVSPTRFRPAACCVTDAANELTGISYAKADGTTLGTLTYSYDAAGHRISQGGTLANTNVPAATSATASYDADNRLTQWNGQTRSYDADGNLTGDGSLSYAWNARNQLQSLSLGWQGRLWIVDKLRAQLDVLGVRGDATYNGFLQNLQTGAPTPLKASTNETFTDLQLKLGKGISFFGNGRDLFTPYGGYGLTAWHRDLGKDAPGGYTEQYCHRF